MKKLVLLSAVFAAALYALPNVGVAESMSNSAKPMLFAVDTGDGTVQTLSFDTPAENEAQATCNMTPNGAAEPVTLDVPEPQVPIRDIPYQPSLSNPISARSAALNPPASGTSRDPRNFPNGPGDPVPDDPDDPPSPSVPEPGTLLIISLGIAGAALARRRKEK
ncbi:MAG: PEP-CTERM sorting domain-containing protein [Planctomycetaceae bacterium]|jgi:hypothetical protein|nr:PEP-CTERM sorting domain-containing protein [Planctomycetaceae bacterium]